jgi:hypothetical protein
MYYIYLTSHRLAYIIFWSHLPSPVLTYHTSPSFRKMFLSVPFCCIYIYIYIYIYILYTYIYYIYATVRYEYERVIQYNTPCGCGLWAFRLSVNLWHLALVFVPCATVAGLVRYVFYTRGTWCCCCYRRYAL